MITATCIHRAGRVTAVSPDLYERVRALLPRVRVLLTIRAQPEWMFSNFHHFVRLLPPDRRSFPHFLNSVEGKIIAAVASYDRLVERLFSVFGRERVLVLPMELLEEDAAQALNRVAAFLHVDDIPFTAADADFNRGIDHLYGQGRATIELPEEPPTRLRAFKERFLRPQPASAVPTKQALRGEFGDLLSALYAASNARLSQLIDCDLAALGYPV